MTKTEFITNASKMGYCTKKQAQDYCKDKEVLTDDDYIEVYRKARAVDHSFGGRVLHGGGKTSKRYLCDGGSEGNR